MPKQQFNMRVSDLTRMQLQSLSDRWGMTLTEAMAIIVDRIYQQEKPEKPMNRDYFQGYHELEANLDLLPTDAEIWLLDSGAYVVGSLEQVVENHGDNAKWIGTVAVLKAERNV